MGTSSANGPISILPEELVVKILSNLAVSDLVSCRLVNHYLNGIVDCSKQLEHNINTAVAGVMDNPNSPLSLLERRDALALRQKAWDTFQPQRTVAFEDKWELELEPNLPDLDGTWLPIEALREEGYYKIEQLAACPDNNELVAIGMRCGHVPFQNFVFENHSFEVVILSFYEAAGERSWTRKATVHVKDILRKDQARWSMKIEIHTNLLAVHLTPESTRGIWPDKELRVFDWTTGEEVACLKGQGINAFRFLSNSVMLVGSVSPSESTATLELYSLPTTNGNLHPTSITKVAALGLPFVDNGCRIARMDFYPLFVKNLVIHRQRLLYNTSIDAKPFINTKSDNILFIYLNIGGGYGYDNISFIVHSSTLLRHATASHARGEVTHLVPWELWGPSVTRWYEGGISVAGGPVTCGHRCLINRGWELWELWDFNPYRVRSLGTGFTVENETSCLTVETTVSCARSRGITKGIYSSLPFIRLIPKKWHYTYMGLYEHKVVGERFLEGGRYLIENLYFG